jgi:cytochrome c oxidase cbb3-type subunit 2
MFEFHRNEQLLFSTVFLLFVVLTVVIAIGPALTSQSTNEPLPTSEPMTDLERKGLKVYVNEGCVYCHTQQVRPVKPDENLGRPSAPGDYARLQRPGIWRQTPAVLGSERTGPDLTNVGKRQPSQQWHLMHLYNPRAVVSESIMPSFKWLFRVTEQPGRDATVVSMPGDYGPEQGTVVATERAEALVAYLQSLKQAPLTGEGGTDTAGKASADEAGGGDGASIYASNCASCHQTNGAGVPGAFPPLKGDPVVTAEDPTRHVEIVLEGLSGKKIQGTSYSAAMPGFADQLDDQEVAAVVNHERTSWGNSAPTVEPEDVKEIRKVLEEASDESR